MGVYRRSDADTYWMSLVIDGKRLRQDTGVQDRTVAEEIFAAWQVQLARARWLGVPAPTPQHTVQELLAEYAAKVTHTWRPVICGPGSRRWSSGALLNRQGRHYPQKLVSRRCHRNF